MQFRYRYLIFLIAILTTTLCLIKVYENKQQVEVYPHDSQKVQVWKETYHQQWKRIVAKPDLPIIYVVTPTYARPTQKAELIRLSHTLMLVPKLHWIIVEDNDEISAVIHQLLFRSGLKFTHLSQPTPQKYKKSFFDPQWKKPRGVFQRNAAIQWLRQNNYQGDIERVVYFADDDNTYDLQLFEEMRYTTKVSAWPVGLVGGVKLESPIVENGKITGWMVGWGAERPFAIDMAGFAINLRLLLEYPEAEFSADVAIGYVESSLLQKIINIEDIEPKADNCTKVYVWHTRTEKVKFLSDYKLNKFNLKYAHVSKTEV